MEETKKMEMEETKKSKTSLKQRIILLSVIVVVSCTIATFVQITAGISSSLWAIIWCMIFVVEGHLMCWVVWKQKETVDAEVPKSILKSWKCNAPHEWN